MIYKYGEFSHNQIQSTKDFLRKQIFLLLLCVDPKTREEYKHINIDSAFDGLMYKIGGLNSILLEPPELVTVISLLEAARIEYNSPAFSVENFKNCKYRKLILDAGAEVLKIKEV